jgi:[protein-PII] uridylyltransferase
MADVAGALLLARASVRAARVWTEDEVAVSVWEVDDSALDATVLRQRVDAVVARQVDPRRRWSLPRKDAPEPSVQVRHDVSRDATVLEVRAADHPGVVHRVCSALAALDIGVRSAHLATFGPQAADVFYVQEPGAGALSEERAASAAHAVRSALHPPG